MLFTGDSRVGVEALPVEAVSGQAPRRVAGQNGRGKFLPGDSQLGTVVLEAFERKRPLPQRE